VQPPSRRRSCRGIDVAIEENAVTNIISRRAILMAVLAACTVSFAASPAYLSKTRQFGQPGGRTDRADSVPRRTTAAPQRPLHQDPFADLLLG